MKPDKKNPRDKAPEVNENREDRKKNDSALTVDDLKYETERERELLNKIDELLEKETNTSSSPNKMPENDSGEK